MFKVLLIDDEPIIRKGLKNIINWDKFNCKICAEACDGVEGIQCIKNMLPDIIITDIKMPEIDGLTMIKEIKELVPFSKIIILTGYRDFDYAQEAIKLGAFDFILKPSKIEQLTSVIGKAVKELKQKYEKEEEIKKFRVDFKKNLPILKQKLLNDIIFNINTNKHEVLEKLELYGINIEEFVLVVIENDEEEDYFKTDQYNKHIYQFGIINMFKDIFSDTFDVQGISLNNKQVAFVIQNLKNKCDYMSIIEQKSCELQKIVKNCFDFTVTIAISSKGTDFLQLHLKLKECLDALEYKFYVGKNSIILYSDLKLFYKSNDNSTLKNYQKSLLDSIKKGNEKQVREKLREIDNFLNTTGIIDKNLLRDFYWDTIYFISRIRTSVAVNDKHVGTSAINTSSLHNLIEQCDSMKQLYEILEKIALQITSKINDFNNKSIKLILQKAIDYIHKHYSETVTLQDVAEHTYVSTYYISRMFKKELGQNFVDYLNQVRIEKAKELLKNVKYKTYEIAEMVGIPDAHYFSKQFKKYTGITPSEYRTFT